MICSEDFMSDLLDKQLDTEHSPTEPPEAIQYVLDSRKGLWSKMINLDLCDRVSLATLLANVWFLQRLCPFNFFHSRQTPGEQKQVLHGTGDKDLSFCLSLPATVYSVKYSLVISYPLCPHGSAHDLLLSQHGSVGLSEELVCAIVSRAFLCLDRLHSNGLLHRNLCSKHLLLASCSGGGSVDAVTGDTVSVRLCGLGSLIRLSPTAYNSRRIDLPPIHLAWRGWRSASHPARRHPVQWYAPEVLAQDFTGYTWPSDVYSLGLVIFELFTGRPPFPPNLSLTQVACEKLQRAKPPALVKSDGSSNNQASEAMRQVYTACTESLVRRRASVKQILAMPWLRAGLRRPFTDDLLLGGH